MKTDRDNLIERFLLGKLPAEESLRLEEEYFSDNDLFKDILIAENDLIDAYAAGRLSPENKSLFENRLLLSAPQRQRVRFAKALLRYASNHPLPVEHPGTSAPRPSWISVIRQFIFNGPALSFSFAALVLIIIAGAVSLKLYNFDPAGTQTDETAESRILPPPPEQKPVNEPYNTDMIDEYKPDSAAPSPVKPVQPKPTQNKQEKPQNKQAPVIYSLILSPGLTRSAGAGQKFIIPAKTDFVKIRLKFEEGDFSAYHAALETVEGTQVWQSSKLKAQTNDQAVNVLIPARLLKKSDYILTLKGVTKVGLYENVESFAFSISR